MSDYVPVGLSADQFNNPEEFTDVAVGILRAEWNGHITGELTKGCVERLVELGVDKDSICVFDVPGAIELTYAASKLIDSGAVDVCIVFGCVIRGETPHFDYVCQSVTQGITHLNADYDIPVIFGVLTVENEQQALDRIGGAHGHKGIEAADAALKMVRFNRISDI